MRYAWLIGAVASCDGITVPPFSSTTVTSADIGLVPVEQAVRDIAQRRCARQLTCERIGRPTFEQCSNDIQAATHDYLVGVCKSGVHASRLATCLANTDEQPCDRTGDTEPSCSDTQLCP